MSSDVARKQAALEDMQHTIASLEKATKALNNWIAGAKSDVAGVSDARDNEAGFDNRLRDVEVIPSFKSHLNFESYNFII